MEDEAASGGWRCHHVDSPFRRAIAQSIPGPDAEARAGLWARVSHPRLAPIVAVERCGTDWFLLSEIVVGTPLDAFLTERAGHLQLRSAVDVILQLCDALEALHGAGLAHGGLRPSSVFLGPDGRVRLSGPVPASTAEVTDPYQAPEGGVRAQADRFALGGLLALLTAGDPQSLPVHADLAAAITALRAADPEARPLVEAVAKRLQAVRDAQLSRDTGLNSTSGGRLEGVGPSGMPARIGRYSILRELGRGGAGVVYEANDPELRRRVALKVLLSGAFARSRELARFRQEAQVVARFDHEGIVKVLDIGSHGDAAWFAMEFVDGPSLMEAIRTRGPLPWREAVRIVACVARALSHAHGAGLLHRDVKPHNVLLDGGHGDLGAARPKLADFGLALTDDDTASRLTGTGQVLGTPVYMAPEQAMGDVRGLGPATDVYGLGVTLYEALTGRVPFEGATPLQLVGRILRGNPPLPTTWVPTLPRPVELVCSKAIRLEPSDRYVSAAAFAEDLERCLRGEPLSAVEPTLGERARWWARANQELLGRASLSLAAALVAVASMVGALVWWREQSVAATESLASAAWESTRDRMRVARESGDDDAADALFLAYAARPEHAGTRALVRAWWWKGEAATGEARISALASAYAAARAPVDQDASLRWLAREARQQWRFSLLKSVLDTLARRGTDPAADPALRGLWRDALFAERRIAEAAAIPVGDASDSLFAALSGATWTEQHGYWAEPWPDGGLLVHGADHTRVVGASPALPTVLDLEVPGQIDERFATSFRWGDTTLLAWRPTTRDRTVIASFDRGGAARIEWTFPAMRWAAAVADLDGAPGPELYFAAGRAVHRARRSADGTWTEDRPTPETDATNSEIGGLTAFGDGLALAAAEWNAFDVRLLTPDGDRLRVAARRKLGAVWGLAATPDGTLVGCKRAGFPSARSMPADRLDGAPPGLWEFAPDGDGGLTSTLRSPGPCVNEPIAGDIDGDGDTDVAYSDWPHGVKFLSREPDGGFTSSWLPGLALVNLAQLDGDAGLEVIVADESRRLVVLGAGTDTLPVVEADHVVADPVPVGADPVVASSWERAEDLVYTGQLREAAAALREIADLRFGSPLGLAALRRSAALWAAAGDIPAADRAWRDADRAGDPEALERSARLHRDADDDVAELAAILELEARGPLTGDWPAERVRLEGLRTAPTTVLAFEEPLDPRWVVEEPLALRRDRAGLHVETSRIGVLAHLPLEGDPARWVGVDVELDIDRSEWGSQLIVEIVSTTDRSHRLGVAAATSGGGWVLRQEAFCRGPGHPYGWHQVAGDPRPLKIAALRQPDGAAHCWVRDGEPGHQLRPSIALPGEGPWELVLRAEGQPGASTTATLRAVRLTGMTIGGPIGTRSPALALAEGDLVKAGDDPALRIAVAATRGDLQGLRAALDAAPEEQRDAAVAHLLHSRLGTAGPLLREILGAEFPVALAHAWEVPLGTHPPTDERVASVLLPATEGVERARPGTTVDRDALAALLAWRGAAEDRRGRSEVAETSLRRAIELSVDPTFGPVGDLGTAAAINGAYVELAGIRGRAGDRDEAFALLAEAAAHAPSEDVVRDVIASRHALASLHDDARWDAWRRPELPE